MTVAHPQLSLQLFPKETTMWVGKKYSFPLKRHVKCLFLINDQLSVVFNSCKYIFWSVIGAFDLIEQTLINCSGVENALHQLTVQCYI